jgi:hypothetical protein
MTCRRSSSIDSIRASRDACDPARAHLSGAGRVLRLFLIALSTIAWTWACPPGRSDEPRNEVSADSVAIELRVVWGGGVARKFRGTVSLEKGSLSVVRNLSLQPDSIASIAQSKNNTISIQEHSPSTFGGMDVKIDAMSTELIRFRFEDPANNEVIEHNLQVSEILQGNWVRNLDDRGNRIAAERLIQDRLRIKPSENKSVYATGIRWGGSIEGYRSGVVAGEYVLQTSLIDEVTGAVQTKGEEKSVTVNELGSFPQTYVELALPVSEGAYAIEVSLQKKRFLNSLVGYTSAMKRRLDMVTFDYKAGATRIEKWVADATIEPLATQWWTKLNWLSPFGSTQPMVQIPGMTDSSRRPSSSGQQGSRKVDDRVCLMLAPNAWQAYPLTIDHPGQPHRLRVTIPSDQPQRLAVSIRDYHGNGEPTALNLDSGVLIGERTLIQSSGATSNLIEHEMLFWPRSSHPVVHIMNADENNEASFGTIQLDVAQMVSEPPPNSITIDNGKTPMESRMVALYLNKPLLADAFGGQRTIDPLTRRPLESWSTWNQSAVRLTQFLQHSGYNAIILNVLSDGGSIMPAPRLAPTTRFDNGTFFSDGRSPELKDVVELLCCHLDRCNIKLILAMDIDNRLPELEKSIGKETKTDGLYQVDLDGNAWQSEGLSGTRRVLYNPLNQRFQDEMDQIVRQISSRYANHKCFAGLAFELGTNSHLIYAGDRWGYDEPTLQKFESATQAKLPRGDQLVTAMRGAVRLSYISWRAKELSAFYEKLANTMRQVKSDTRLILDPLPMWQNPPSEHDFVDPSAIARNSMDLLIASGIDCDWIKQQSKVALMRGQIENTLKNAAGANWLTQLATDPGMENAIAGNFQCTAFVQGATGIPIAEHAKLLGASASPNLAWSYPLFSEEPSGRRKRIIGQLYREDALTVADGGWMPSQGEWLDLQQLRKTLTALPNVPMQTVHIDKGDSNIRLRSAMVGNDTYIQLINNAPWKERITLDVFVSAAAGLVEILGDRDLQLNTSSSSPQTSRIQSASSRRSTVWQFEVGPYELIAIKISDPQFKLNSLIHSADPEVLIELKQEIENLESRFTQLADNSQLRSLGLAGDFEQWKEGDFPFGWTMSSLPQVRIAPERALPHSGNSCIMLENRNQAKVKAWIQSDSIQIPSSGRLMVEAWVRSSIVDAAPQTIRISVLGRTRDGRGYQRSQDFGSQPNEISTDWGKRPLRLHVADVPTDNLVDLKVAIDLVGPGKIWIDDVQAFETYLTPEERMRIDGQLLLAKRRLPENNAFAAERAVNSPWARYLKSLGPKTIFTNSNRTDSKEAEESKSNARKPTNSGPIFRQLRDTMRDRWMK